MKRSKQKGVSAVPERGWSSYEEVEEAVQLIREMMNGEGSLTREIVERYQRRMAGSSHNLINYFYSRLETESPGALIFFLNGYLHEKL